MKRIISGFIVLLVLVCVSSVSFGDDLKSITLVYSNNAPARAGGNMFFANAYLPKINGEIAKFGYKLDVTMYHASSLYKYQDQVNAVEKGLIDITNFICSWEEARAPLHMVLNLPLMGYSPQSHAKIWTELQETIPEFGKEFSNYQELFHISATPGIFNMKVVRRVPADFKGLKISSTGVSADFFKSIGATPLRIDAPDWYSSLDRGMVDVLPLGAFLAAMWKIDEVAKVQVIPSNAAVTWTALSFVMSRKGFDRLPKEVQKVIKDNLEWATVTVTKGDDEFRIQSEEKFKKEGNTVIYLTSDEIKQWQDAAIPTHMAWIKEMEAKGLPGQKVYDEAKRLIAKYGNL
jgi:TRAP-type C4-dicarboxylate transport system substrate-binding protein